MSQHTMRGAESRGWSATDMSMKAYASTIKYASIIRYGSNQMKARTTQCENVSNDNESICVNDKIRVNNKIQKQSNEHTNNTMWKRAQGQVRTCQNQDRHRRNKARVRLPRIIHVYMWLQEQQMSCQPLWTTKTLYHPELPFMCQGWVEQWQRDVQSSTIQRESWR